MTRHLKPISRMNSAVATRSLSGSELVTYWKRAFIEPGASIVIIVAVKIASHIGRPSSLVAASCSAFLIISWIFAVIEEGFRRARVICKTVPRVGETFNISA
jgi:hypothetical protein